MFAANRVLAGRCPLLPMEQFDRKWVEEYWSTTITDIKWQHLRLVHQVRKTFSINADLQAVGCAFVCLLTP